MLASIGRRSRVLAFHERLAQLGLGAVARYGFVLAGGYALSANGIGDRPSKDVDLFTNVSDPARFAAAVEDLKVAMLGAGMVVEDMRIGPTFADLRIIESSTGLSSDLQMGLDFRQFPPAQMSVGPVLDLRDAVAGKVSALWSRGEARDYIDVAAVLASGKFTREELLVIGDQVETVPMDRSILATRFREAERHDWSIYADYGVGPERRAQIVAIFRDWADRVDSAAPMTHERVAPPPAVDPRREPAGYQHGPETNRGITL